VCVCVYLNCALFFWNLNTSHSEPSLEKYFFILKLILAVNSHDSFQIPERRDFFRLTFLNLSMELL
jgi:hypothetical protein